MPDFESWIWRARRTLAAWISPASSCLLPPLEAQPSQKTPAVPNRQERPGTEHLLSPIRFEGTLSGHGSRIPVRFDLWIDHDGLLHVRLDAMLFSREAKALWLQQRPGSTVDLLDLVGVSAESHRVSSNSFTITQFRHGSDFELQGHCYEADLAMPRRPGSEGQPDCLIWHVRQLATFRKISQDTPLGRVIIIGPERDPASKRPNGTIAIVRPQGIADPNWNEQSGRLLTHVARVMSFACDTYLRPVIEERHADGEMTLRISRQTHASAPFMPPFDLLQVHQIVPCACQSHFDRHDEIERLDAAIRWMTAPVTYDESRLINAMSALENILARTVGKDIEHILDKRDFKKMAKTVRDALNAADAPAAMISKVAELNRRALVEKVDALLERRGISTDDLPAGWLATIIKHRNIIVHTGISAGFDDAEPDTFDHTIWAREIITRIIFERLGYVGGYQSSLHGQAQWRFPECISMEQWVRQAESATTGAPFDG